MTLRLTIPYGDEDAYVALRYAKNHNTTKGSHPSRNF